MTSQPRSVRGTLIPWRKRRYRRDPRRNASAAPVSTIWSAMSKLTWAIKDPSWRRTGIPMGFARLLGGADSDSGLAAGGPVNFEPPLIALSEKWGAQGGHYD